MSALQMVLAFESPFPPGWYHGITVSESVELAFCFILFMGTLVTVYFIQRWIGDY